MMEPRPEAGAPQNAGPQGFLAWFPWEKTLIWGLFLLVVYILRHFFFIIFMTFMIAYIMSSLVGRVMRLLSPHQERPWLQRLVSVVGFAFLIAFLYGVGAFLYHPLRQQATELVSYARSLDPESILNEVLRGTVGAWQWSHYPEHRKREDFEKEFLRKKSPAETYEEFGKEIEKIESDFQNEEILALGERRFDELKEDKSNTLFARWLLENVAEKEFQEYRDKLIENWINEREDLWILKKFPPPRALPPRDEIRKSPEYQTDRDQEIKEGIVVKIIAGHDREKHKKYTEEFKRYLGREVFGKLSREDREERFRQFYDRGIASPLGKRAYEDFDRLRAAWEKGKVEFSAELKFETPLQRETRLWKEFRHAKEMDFVKKALGPDEWVSMQVKTLKVWLAEKVPVITGRLVGNVGLYLFQLIVQFGLCLLLSFFITLDLPRLRRGVQRLENSRVRNLYHEIAPGLISFGRLIGRSFQAQGLIAICNTILTFLALRLLGIQNEVFLCSIVFICSFIPVLGVVLSSIPIAVMALIQPGGDFWLALKVIGAILIIHFIEASFLNPKILGDMLHLHPVLVLGILAVGQYFFGAWGLLLGVPVAVYIIRHVILGEEVVEASQPLFSGAFRVFLPPFRRGR